MIRLQKPTVLFLVRRFTMHPPEARLPLSSIRFFLQAKKTWFISPEPPLSAAACAGSTATLDQLNRYFTIYEYAAGRALLIGTWLAGTLGKRCCRTRKIYRPCAIWRGIWPGCCIVSKPAKKRESLFLSRNQAIPPTLSVNINKKRSRNIRLRETPAFLFGYLCFLLFIPFTYLISSYIAFIEGIAAFRTEFRRMGRIFRLPAAFIALIKPGSCRFGFPAFRAEPALIHRSAGAYPSLPPQVWAFRTRNRTFRYYPRPRSCSSSFPPQAYSPACTPALRPAKAVRKPPAGGSSVPFQIAALH